MNNDHGEKRSWWKIDPSQDEHVFLSALLPFFLTFLLPHIGLDILKAHMDMVQGGLILTGSWMMIWFIRRGRFFRTYSKKLLNVWIGVNVIMSILAIVLTIGAIFFGW